MTDRSDIARLLVLQKAILDVLKDADAETRDQAKAIYAKTEADLVEIDGREMGRVSRNRPTKKRQVVDWRAFEAWVDEVVPHEWISTPRVNPSFVSAVCKTGQYIDGDGVVHEVPGIGTVETPGNLVVTTTEAAEDWARQITSSSLKAIEP